MPMNNQALSKELAFKSELVRKIIHVCSFILPLGYYFLEIPRSTALAILVPAALLMLLIDIARLRRWRIWRYPRPLIEPLLRNLEKRGDDFSGAAYILIAMCLTVALFSREVVLISMAFIAFGDPASSLVGRFLGRHRFGNRSLEGSLAFLIVSVAVAALAPGLPILVKMTGVVTATVTEALSFKIDDNISVPVVSGLIITLMGKIY
jgi:dolichol kinase